MRKPGKLQVEKVTSQLPAPVTNSLTKLDFYVDVDVGHHVDHLVYLRAGVSSLEPPGPPAKP